MKLSIFGTGYVGLVSGACLAEVGHDVVCMDVDPVKIANLKAGILPIWEPGLAALVERNAKEGRLRFTTDAAHAVQHAQVQFIAVGTPPDEDGSADMQYVLAVAQSIASHMTGYKVIVNKSTVPVGTADQVTAAINAVIASRTPVIASEARQSSGHGSPRPFGPRDDDAGAVIASPSTVIASPSTVIASAARRSIVEKSGFMDCHTTFAMTAGSWKAKRGNPYHTRRIGKYVHEISLQPPSNKPG